MANLEVNNFEVFTPFLHVQTLRANPANQSYGPDQWEPN